LIGLGIDSSCPEQLLPYVLPYDARFDGPDSDIPGTRGDFASRALRHFAEVIFPNSSNSLETHKRAVVRHLKDWRMPRKLEREPKSDEDIIKIIKRTWATTKGQSGRALRHLRDVEEIACEQGRFRLLFHRAAKQVLS
jgi:hypothetical protein